MTTPLLTIAIPTYNRCDYLKQTLTAILAQKSDEVNIVICDNCSQDDTAEYLASLGESITYFRQEINVGADNNFISCLTHATGDYVWTLCDDDIPCSNTLDSILGGIKASKPPALFITPIPTDKNVSIYDATPVHSTWISCDRDEFLDRVGVWFTFGSSAVVRRDALDMDFIQAQNGSALVPAAIMLSAVGRNNKVLVSSEPLLYARGDNSGGYSAFIVFSHNLSRLLRSSKQLGFNPRSMIYVYNHSLSMVIVTFIVQGWRLSLPSLITLTKYSYRHRSFYTSVIPALIRRYGRPVKRSARFVKHLITTPFRAKA